MNPQINPCFSLRKLILKLNFNYNLESNFLRLQITDVDTNPAASQLVPTPTPNTIHCSSYAPNLQQCHHCLHSYNSLFH